MWRPPTNRECSHVASSRVSLRCCPVTAATVANHERLWATQAFPREGSTMLRGLVLVTAAASALALTAAGPSAAATAAPPTPIGTSPLGDLVGRPATPPEPRADSVLVVTDGTTAPKFGAQVAQAAG